MAFSSGNPFAPIFTADFNSDENGFVFLDDTFRATGQPDYADGVRVPAGGVTGGALQILLGNVDNDDIIGMSGGWEREFTLTEPTFVKLTFQYKLTQASDYEPDEFSEVLVALDGVLQGLGGNDFIDRITGDGDGGSEITTGFVQVELDLGLLDAGTHTITLGGFNNKKTFNNEETEILFDDVALEGSTLPADSTVLLNENFDTDTGGFVFQDDTFRGTNEPDYADGQRVETGGENGGVLQVALGNVDNDDITGMSGGWVQQFELTEASSVKLCFRFNMTHAANYEADEFSEVLVSLDGVLQGLDGNDFIAQIFGNGNGGPAQTTGWQEVELDLGILGPGIHTLALGGFNNKKTLVDESTEILFDDVILVQSNADPVKLFDDNGDFVAGFSTLEDAIAASSADFRIEIVETTLATGPAQIVIPHNLTIEGAGQGQTILQASADTGSAGDARGWFLVDSGVNLDLSGVTLDGNGFKIFQGIRHKGTGTIDDVQFLDIAFQEVGGGSPFAGTGVAAFGEVGAVDVFNSTFQGIGRIGVLYFGPGTTGTFQNNTYIGKGAGDHLDYALDISNGAVVQVLDNEVSNNRGVASTDNSASAAFLVTTFFGPGTNATFEGNTLDNNTSGVVVGLDSPPSPAEDSSTVTFNAGNTITNSENGVVVNGNPVINTPENVTGDSASFNYDGASAANNFGGAAQDDVFDGGGDNDTLFGREGGDTFVYFTGDNSAVGSDGDDTIDGGTTGVGPVDSDRDTLVIEGLNNQIFVNIQDGETFDGIGGFADDHIAITVDGLGPDSTLDVDNIEDIVIGDGTNSWVVNITGDFSGTDLAPGTITLNGGNGGDGLDASDLTSAHNIVAFGGDQNDTMIGGAGNDTLDGGVGEFDLLAGGGGDDAIDGGEGDNDRATFSGSVADYTITLLPDGSLQVADNIPNRDGTDTVKNVEVLSFSSGPLPVGPVLVFDGSGVFQGGFDTIQAGVDAALDGFTVLVAPGTFNENVSIVNKSITLLSSGGRDVTTIEGIENGDLGTIFLDGITDGTQIGDVGQGFTVIGFDGPPGIEKAAFYARANAAPGHTNLTIEGNEFVAKGDSALTFEFNDHFDGVTIENNIFSGTAFDPDSPIGDPTTFANQFTTDNVARQLVVIGGGSGVTNTQNIDFLNNEVTGTTGGVVKAGETFNDAGSPTVATTDIPFGNTLATIDVVGGNVIGNNFTGTSGRFGSGLRVRGPNTEIEDNSFDNTDGGDSRGVFQQTFDGDFTGNSFVGGEGSDIFSGSAGPDQINGNGGKDFLIGQLGDDTINGGADIDTAAFNGSAADYTVVFGTDGSPTTIIDANFDAGADGFVFQDDTFRGTTQPDYASGQQIPVGGFDGGALQVLLGNVDDADILGMSGGFEQTFNLPEAAQVTLSFRFNLTQAANYEADEFSQVLVALDGVLQGLGVTDFIAQINGNGNGGGPISTGFQQVEIDLGVLSAGNHTLTLGGFNNKKTLADEETEVLFDDVLLTSTPPPIAETVFEADFDAGADGFVFQDDTFRGTNQPVYADGTVVNPGGFVDGGLQVTLGNVDNADILGMSGGFNREFTLDEPAEVTVTFRYNLTQSADYEADEFSQVLLAVDGVLQGTNGNDFIDQITGNGNGGGAQSTGFQQVTVNLGELSAGTHTLTLGGFNNKKTFANEETEVVFDDVVVTKLTSASETTVTDDNASDGNEGTDTLIDIENLFFFGEDPVQVFDSDGNFVNAFTTIQGAIDDAGTLDGFKIVIGPGEFNENVTVNKELTIAGAGTVLLNGEGLGGNGITIAADNVTIDPLTITNFGLNGVFVGTAVSNLVLDGIRTTGNAFDGIRVDAQVTSMTLLGVESSENAGRGFHVQTNGDITDLTLTEVSFSNNTQQGLRVASSGQLDGVTVTNSHFDDNEYGWYVANDGSTSSVQNVSVSDTTFDRNFDAAIYAETMVGADFTNVTAIDSGTGPANNIAFDFVAFYDLTEVSDITFDGFTVQNTTNDTVFSAFRFEGFQAALAGFGDSPSPTDITIQNGTVDNVERVVRTNAGPGEFTQNNIILTNIADFESQQRGNESSDTFNGDFFSNSDRDLLEGEAGFLPGGAADTLNGFSGNDVLIGRLGNDELNGGDGLDAALFEGLGSEYSVTFGLDGLPSSVTDTNAADGDEGTDTLDSIETLFFLSEEVVQVFDATGNFVDSYTTIQAAVDDATTLDGFKVVIGSGTFNESVTVDKALTFVGVDVGTGLPTITPPAGSAFVLSGDLGAGNTVGFHNLNFEDAPRSGIQLGGDVTLGTLTVTDSNFSANASNGIEVFNGENLSNFVLENSTFLANGQPSGSSGDGDVLLFNYEGDAILRDLQITGADRGTGPAENGIQFRGDNGPNLPEGPLGTVLFENITIDGIYEKQPIAFFNYDNVDGLSMTNVQVLADSLGFNLALNFDGISGNVDFSTFDVTFANDPAAIQDTNLADNNIFIGGDGDEILNGKAGDDILIGGNGEDLIIGSIGTDTLTGGGDADTFLFALGDGGPNLALADVITDWEDGIDQISLAGGLTFEDLEISNSNGDAVIAAGAEVLAVVNNSAGQLDATDFIVA